MSQSPDGAGLISGPSTSSAPCATTDFHGWFRVWEPSSVSLSVPASASTCSGSGRPHAHAHLTMFEGRETSEASKASPPHHKLTWYRCVGTEASRSRCSRSTCTLIIWGLQCVSVLLKARVRRVDEDARYVRDSVRASGQLFSCEWKRQPAHLGHPRI